MHKARNAVYTIDYWSTVPGYANYLLRGYLFGSASLSELNKKATIWVNGQRRIRFRAVR